MQSNNETPTITPIRKSLGLSRRFKCSTPSPSPKQINFSTPVSYTLYLSTNLAIHIHNFLKTTHFIFFL